MKKKILSDSTKRWLKILFLVMGFSYLFYLLTNLGVFICLCLGICAGTCYVIISSYFNDKRREKAYDEYINKMNRELGIYDAENITIKEEDEDYEE